MVRSLQSETALKSSAVSTSCEMSTRRKIGIKEEEEREREERERNRETDSL